MTPALPAGGPRKPARQVPSAYRTDPDAFVDDFHRHLGRLVHATAQLDFSIGLQLRWMGPALGVDVTADLDPAGAKLLTRLKRLKSLTRRGFSGAGAAAHAEFDSWFRRAERARALRNDYVHGRWGVPAAYEMDAEGRLNGQPLLGFVPLNWNLSPDQPDPTVLMTMQAFAQQVDHAERLTADFFRLQDLHGRWFGWPAAGR